MGKLQIVPVDERDSGWESPNPRFRVYFQRTQGSWVGGWTDTYDITGADIVQVIDWAQRQAGSVFLYSIALVYDDRAMEQSMPGHGRALVWLVGMDGNRGEDDLAPEEAEIQRRMLARRREPVIVPSPDQIAARHPRALQRRQRLLNTTAHAAVRVVRRDALKAIRRVPRCPNSKCLVGSTHA